MILFVTTLTHCSRDGSRSLDHGSVCQCQTRCSTRFWVL